MQRLAIVTAVLLGSTALATAQTKQNQTPTSPPPPASSPYQTSAHSQQDLSATDFVNKAAMSNMFEIQSSQQALERSSDDQVKAFAQRLIDDHRKATTALKNAAVKQEVPSELNQRHQKMLLRLHRATDQNFDQRFLRMQISVHRDAVNMFEVFASSGDDEQLQNFAEATAPTLRQHLQRAQQLLASLDQHDRSASVGSSQGGRNDGRNPGRASDASRSLNVVQPPPRVTVLQRQPSVEVRQPRPQITIHQPAPTITIEQPQPQITVRMPSPSVDVNQQRPKVTVNVPPPRLTSSGDRQAVVNIQKSGGEPNIDVQRAASPDIKFERDGPPTVHIRQAAGQPQIRYEQMSDSETRNLANADPSKAQRQNAGENAGMNSSPDSAVTVGARNAQASTSVDMPADQPDRNARYAAADDQDWVAEARRRANEGDAETTASVNANSGRTVTMSVDDLENMSVYNAKGRKLGDVERVVVDQSSNKTFLVLAHGGFLGMFEDEVAIPMNRIRAGDDRLVIHGLTPTEISQMPDWENKIPNHSELDGNQQTKVQVWK